MTETLFLTTNNNSSDILIVFLLLCVAPPGSVTISGVNSVIEGQPFHLTCFAMGYPIPSYEVRTCK